MAKRTVTIDQVRVYDRTWTRNGPGDEVTMIEAQVMPNGRRGWAVTTRLGVLSGEQNVLLSLWTDEPACQEMANTIRDGEYVMEHCPEVATHEAHTNGMGWQRVCIEHAEECHAAGLETRPLEDEA